MRKLSIIYILLALVFTVKAQKIDRNLVVVEVGTGTWCTYCPGAALGVDDLVHNGQKVAVIEYHNGDDYANGYSNSRNSYYQVSGYPTTNFDGGDAYSGGHPSESLYGTFLVKYQAAIAKQTAIAMEMNYSLSNDTCFAQFIVSKVADVKGTLVLHVAVTESHIEENWQGLEELNFVERTMVPNAEGTILNLTTNNVDTINLVFKTSRDWDIANCEVVAFVQDKSTKEIHNGLKEFLEILPDDIDAQLNEVSIESGNGYCKSELPLRVLVENRGNNTINTLRFQYSVNEGTAAYFSWKGELGSRKKMEIEIPGIEYTLLDKNELNVKIELVNGIADANMVNNEKVLAFLKAPTVEKAPIKLNLKTDSFGSEINWKITDAEQKVLYSGGPYADNTVEMQEYTFSFAQNGCYKFEIFDTAGDGLDGVYDKAYFILTDSEGVKLDSGSNFGFEHSYSFLLAAPEDESQILAFQIGGFSGNINTENHTIIVDVNHADAPIIPEFSLSTGAIAYVGDIEQVSGESVVEFDADNKITYSIVSGDGTSKTDWIITLNTVGVNTEFDANSNVLYPNPFDQKFYINTTQFTQRVKVTSTLGQCFYDSKNIQSPLHTIDLSEAPHGIYLVTIFNESNAMQVTKIIKQKN